MGCMWWNWIFFFLTVVTSSRLSFLFKKLSTYIEAFKSFWWRAILRAWAHSLFELIKMKTRIESCLLVFLMCVCVSVCVSCSVVSDSLLPHGLYSAARLLCPWNSPCKNTEVGSHSLLQAVFLSQVLNHIFCIVRQILYHLSHQGSPISLNQIFKWVLDT